MAFFFEEDFFFWGVEILTDLKCMIKACKEKGDCSPKRCTKKDQKIRKIMGQLVARYKLGCPPSKEQWEMKVYRCPLLKI